MKRSQLAKGLFIALCAVMLSGCQTSSPGKDRRPETDSATSQSQQSPDTGSDIDSLAASALAHGDVVEFYRKRLHYFSRAGRWRYLYNRCSGAYG